MVKQYPQIIRLARSGSLERAWALMDEHGLLDSESDQRALTLQGRLMKDRAKRHVGPERARLFGESAALYAKAGAIDRGSYPLINAATLSLLAGKEAQSRKLANEVLAVLEANPDEAETPYWLGATRAEALLLLGQPVEARAALRHAVSRQPAAWEDHAATIGQFELLCAELGEDSDWLDQLRPPLVLQFAGIMTTAQEDHAVRMQIDEWLERENIGFGFGALAAGSDIWIAEALLERGAELNIVLPCAESAFREISVRGFGEEWLKRYDAIAAQATSLEILDHAALPDKSAVARAEAVAQGMAMQLARQLRTGTRRLRILGLEDDALDVPELAILRAKRLQPRIHDTAPIELSAQVIKDGVSATYSAIGEAWSAIVASPGRAAIDFVPANSAHSQKVSDRLAAMFDCSGPEQVHASQAAAFALLASGADIHAENAGDMRWTGGIDPLYFVA